MFTRNQGNGVQYLHLKTKFVWQNCLHACKCARVRTRVCLCTFTAAVKRKPELEALHFAVCTPPMTSTVPAASPGLNSVCTLNMQHASNLPRKGTRKKNMTHFQTVLEYNTVHISSKNVSKHLPGKFEALKITTTEDSTGLIIPFLFTCNPSCYYHIASTVVSS